MSRSNSRCVTMRVSRGFVHLRENFIVGVDDVYDSRTIEGQVWDRDPYGIREYMGKVRIDLNALLLHTLKSIVVGLKTTDP